MPRPSHGDSAAYFRDEAARRKDAGAGDANRVMGSISTHQPGRPRVLIAGAGVAGLETLLALRALASDRVEITIVAPELKFLNRAMSVDRPFRPKRARGIRLEKLFADFDARWVRGDLDRIEHGRRAVTRDGTRPVLADLNDTNVRRRDA